MFIELSDGELINTDHIANIYRDDYTPARPWALVYGHTLRHYSQTDYDKIKKATLPDAGQWQGCDSCRHVVLSEFDRSDTEQFIKNLADIVRAESRRE